MSAVPEPAFVSPRTPIGRAGDTSRHDPGLASRGRARLAAERQSIRIDAPRGDDAFGSVDAGRLEALILRHCARQIVAAVGRNASVVDVGEVESPSAALLRAALDRSSNECGGARRRLFVLPPGRMDRMGRAAPVEGLRLLRELGERCGADDLLVAGAALPSPRAIGETFRLSAGEPIHVAASYPLSVGRFERLAADAGWQHCQLWSDGQARYAVHVLERSRRSARLSS